jgi:hypothetical protein
MNNHQSTNDSKEAKKKGAYYFAFYFLLKGFCGLHSNDICSQIYELKLHREWKLLKCSANNSRRVRFLDVR